MNHVGISPASRFSGTGLTEEVRDMSGTARFGWPHKPLRQTLYRPFSQRLTRSCVAGLRAIFSNRPHAETERFDRRPKFFCGLKLVWQEVLHN